MSRDPLKSDFELLSAADSLRERIIKKDPREKVQLWQALERKLS